MLLAWGVRHDAREELMAFRVAQREDAANWTAFMTELEARGLSSPLKKSPSRCPRSWG